WGVLFSHPRDYTPVCTTELGRAAKLSDEFKKRNVKMIALSIDSVEDHVGWSKVRPSEGIWLLQHRLFLRSLMRPRKNISWSSQQLIPDIMAYNNEEPGCKFPFPIIADDKRELAVTLGMLDPDERDKDGMPLTARCVFVIGPDKKMKLSILYPATTGRNFDELLRVIDSLQLTAKKRVATPVNWKVSSASPKVLSGHKNAST
ncbi:hypothetical protein JZ751_024840, partial [Albula glossodonta]